MIFKLTKSNEIITILLTIFRFWFSVFKDPASEKEVINTEHVSPAVQNVFWIGEEKA